jgi:hypothetical protein
MKTQLVRPSSERKVTACWSTASIVSGPGENTTDSARSLARHLTGGRPTQQPALLVPAPGERRVAQHTGEFGSLAPSQRGQPPASPPSLPQRGQVKGQHHLADQDDHAAEEHAQQFRHTPIHPSVDGVVNNLRRQRGWSGVLGLEGTATPCRPRVELGTGLGRSAP